MAVKPNMAKKVVSKVRLVPRVRLKRMDFSVPISNSFGVLQNINDTGRLNTKGSNGTASTSKKPNALVITDIDAKLDSVLGDLNIRYHNKLVGTGKKIFMDSTEDKNRISAALIANNIPSYSHPESGEKTLKVVLSGLPEIPIEEIKNSLITTNNLNPKHISMLQTSNHSKLYLLHFDKMEINMADIKKINIVYKHVVRWSPFRPKKKGPTQCYKCALYGHGASNCHRVAVCFLCGKEHIMKECPLYQSDTQTAAAVGSQPQVVFKCFNCAKNNLPHNHKANDIMCPSRQQYIEIRNRINDRNSRRSHTNTAQISSQPGSHNQIKFIDAPTPPPLAVPYAKIIKSHSQPSHTTTNSISQITSSSGLWSLEEVTNILFESINELSKCTTKLDQMKVITSLLSKCI